MSSNSGTDNVSKISFFSFISHLAMELWSGKLNFHLDIWQRQQFFFPHYQSLIIVTTIDISIVNNANQTGRRVTVFHWQAKVWYPCRIQESECKFTSPNKNKNNFTCLLLYQFAAILSQKYQAFPAVVAFNQGLSIFHFLF
jgi:hypothetical protein